MVFYSRFKKGNKSPKWSGKVSKYKAVYNDIKSKNKRWNFTAKARITQ